MLAFSVERAGMHPHGTVTQTIEGTNQAESI